jgi:hypothetical protein
MNCQRLRGGVGSRRHTAAIDRKLAVELGEASHRTVNCPRDKDAGTVDEDGEAPEVFDDRFDQPLNTCARTVR